MSIQKSITALSAPSSFPRLGTIVTAPMGLGVVTRVEPSPYYGEAGQRAYVISIRANESWADWCLPQDMTPILGTSDPATWQIADSALPPRARPDTGLKAVVAEMKRKSRICPQCGEVHEWQVVVECPDESDASDPTWFGYIDGDLADYRYEDTRDRRGI